MATPTLREDALQGLGVSFDILAAFADKLPFPAPAIFTLAKSVIINVEGVEGNQEECTALSQHTSQLLAVVLAAMKAKADNRQEHYIPAHLEQNVKRFHETLEKINKTVTKIHTIVHSKRKRDKVRAFVSTKWYTSELKTCTGDLNWAMDLFKAGALRRQVTDQLENSLRVYHASEQINKLFTNSILESVPRAKRASSTAARHDSLTGCFEGTRTAILDLILEWMVDLDPKLPKCFWLKGLAGIGKSTIAYSIAKLARSRGLLVVDFFFSRLGDKELRDPNLVFPTLAYQLALLDPEFSRVITTALETHPDAGYSSLKKQLDQLIIEPLSKVKPDPKRIVILVLDAFDECEAKGAKDILQLLVAALPFLPFFFKIFITSRPEQHIRSVLVPSNNLQITALHDIEDSIVKEDIENYLRARLRALPEELGRDDLGEGWITEAQIKLLAEAAGTLFIHVATALRFLMDILGPRKQLKLLIEFIQSPRQAHKAQPFASLDELYLQILRGIISRTTGGAIAQLFRTVVGSIVLLRDPLPVRALERLTDLDDDDATELLKNLHSIILPPGPPDYCPRSYHPSFPDFLLDHSRCSDDKLWIDAGVHEPRLALRCLEIMNELLHKNMLGVFDTCLLNSEVENLDARVEEYCLPELRYACLYWATHLAVVIHPANDRIRGAVEIFTSRSLLPWLELLSWIGQTRTAIPSLEAANAWATKSACSPTTLSLLNDGYRLLLTHFPSINESALHIARSVLPLAPRGAQLTSTYANYADSNIEVIDGTDAEWSSCLMTLKGHTDTVTSVAVSPDGTRIVSGSADKTLRIWSANAGNVMAILEGHTDWVRSVAFSPDGDRAVSGSDDGTVRLWDVTTGREVSKLEGHSQWVSSVSFSPDGDLIASGSNDQTIQIWDAATGSTLLTFEEHSDGVSSVAFFPKGRRLASGSRDYTVRVWDLEAETCVSKLEGHSDDVVAVAVSPDGLQITSGSFDKTLRIWDAYSGNCVGILQEHTGFILAIGFSPNGSHIVSGSADEYVRLWDATTHSNLATYKGHGGMIMSVAFSQEGHRMVSGSADQSIKVWDATSTQVDVGDNRSGGIVSLAFSSDKSRLAVLTSRLLVTVDFGLSVHVRDSATPRGPDLFSFTSTDSLQDYSWNSRIRFTTGDTRIVVTVDEETFVYDASNGNLLEHLKNTDEKGEAKGKEGDGGGGGDDDNSDHPGQPLFTLEDGKILRHDASTSTVACILPPSLQANGIASSEIDGGAGHRILVGCRDGRIVTLHIT